MKKLVITLEYKVYDNEILDGKGDQMSEEEIWECVGIPKLMETVDFNEVCSSFEVKDV